MKPGDWPQQSIAHLLGLQMDVLGRGGVHLTGYHSLKFLPVLSRSNTLASPLASGVSRNAVANVKSIALSIKDPIQKVTDLNEKLQHVCDSFCLAIAN